MEGATEKNTKGAAAYRVTWVSSVINRFSHSGVTVCILGVIVIMLLYKVHRQRKLIHRIRQEFRLQHDGDPLVSLQPQSGAVAPPPPPPAADHKPDPSAFIGIGQSVMDLMAYHHQAQTIDGLTQDLASSVMPTVTKPSPPIVTITDRSKITEVEDKHQRDDTAVVAVGETTQTPVVVTPAQPVVA